MTSINPDHTELLAMLGDVLTRALGCKDKIDISGHNAGWKNHWKKVNKAYSGRSKHPNILKGLSRVDFQTLLDALASSESRMLEALPPRALPCFTSYEWLSPKNRDLYFKRLEEANAHTK